MNPEEKFERDVARFTRSLRLIGGFFFVTGSCFFVYVVVTAFDPAGQMIVNHVKTTDFGTKLGVAAFIAIFPAIGAVCVFTPRPRLQRFLTPFLRQAMDAVPKFGARK
jgi:hypothetical protein